MMKNNYNQTAKNKKNKPTATKKSDLFYFASYQFKQLMEKNLRVPIKLYQL